MLSARDARSNLSAALEGIGGALDTGAANLGELSRKARGRCSRERRRARADWVSESESPDSRCNFSSCEGGVRIIKSSGPKSFVVCVCARAACPQ